MKRIFLFAIIAMTTAVSYGREVVSPEAVVTSDTIYYAANKMNVSNRSEASYYRLLMTQGKGANKQEVFKDFYLNGTLKAEGGYDFIDLGNDGNTVLNGEVTTYYPDGKIKSMGKYVNGKREGFFNVQMSDGSIASMEFVGGQSKYDYFLLTRKDGSVERRPIAEIKSLL